MPTIVTTIEKLERDIKECQREMDTISKTLKRGVGSPEQTKQLSERSRELEACAEDYERELKHLRKENRKTMLASVLILILLALTYAAFFT